MIKNHKFLSLFAITLCAALLLSMGSRATRVFALADPVQAISPIYDTQIYQLQDYIEHGGLTSGQLDIFYTLAGFYVLGQAGSTGYKLIDPYSNSDSVWDWLKSCGIEMYNTVIGLIPDTGRMPITGDLYSTVPFKKASQLYVATLMGAAVKAATFSSYQEFKDEVEESGTYWLPWNLDVQKGMNSIFGIYGGIYDWQFDDSPFSSNVSWNTEELTTSALQQYNSYKSDMDSPLVRANRSSTYHNTIYSNPNLFTQYFNIFINSSAHTINIVNSAGNYIPVDMVRSDILYTNGPSVNYYHEYTSMGGGFFIALNTPYDSSQYTTELQLVRAIYDNTLTIFTNDNYLFLEDWIQHVYIGTNWLNKREIFNISDLNFEEPEQDYYVAPENELDLYLDIKGILTDILHNTDLFYVFMNNLFKDGGIPVQDSELIRITTDIYDLLQQTNPVMPVNLNDISDYTNNTYLDLVKRHGENFGETIGQYVAFWHNSDPEITYVIFGAIILTLVGAFVGKWGHS